MRSDKLDRTKRTVIITVLFASALLVYLGICAKWHIGIPCLFNKVTGLNCPGCGVTRGLLALLRLDFKSAAQFNIFIFPSIIYVSGVYFHSAYQYIKTGNHKVSFPVKYVDIIYLILLIFWWVLRNVINL